MVTSSDVMPLADFPADMRARIEAGVAQPTPPDRWLPVGDPFHPLAYIPSRAWFEWYWQRGLAVPGERPSRPRIPDDLRATVYERDGHACLHCGATDRLSLDHIYPWSLGGEDTLENLQTLCRSCNSRKGVRV